MLESGRVRGLAVLFVLSVAMPARADEPARVRVEAEGECPTRVDLEAALASLDIGTNGEGDTAWVVRAVHPPHGATRFELVPPGASEPVERRAIASPDCEALAQTFALIVHTHFTELGLEVAPPLPPPPVDEVFPEDERAEPEPTLPVEPSPPVPTRWEIGIGVLGGISVDPLLPSLLAQLDASYLPEATGPFVLRVLFAGSLPTTQSGIDSVTRWALRPGIEAGVRLGNREWWFQALGGIVVDIAAITATDVPLFWRASPAIDLAAGFGILLGDVFWLRIEASEQIWLTYDRYLVDPDGTIVARSPVSSTVLGLSLLLAL